jgi:hypothetical protein
MIREELEFCLEFDRRHQGPHNDEAMIALTFDIKEPSDAIS